MKTKILFAWLALGILGGCQQHMDYIQSYYYNEKFRYYLNQKSYEKAQNAELSAKENLQDHFELDSNLGIGFNLLTKNGEAEKSFEQSLKSAKNPAELFVVHYNRGVFFQSQSKVDEALKDYQAALDVNPTSMETKTNIELLIQKQKQDQKKQGQGQDQQKKNDDQKQDPKDQKQDNKDGKNGNDKPEDKPENGKDKDNGKEAQPNPKYQPRPFKGDQLSEGDVKKILGELAQQDKKIRSQADKKEKEETGVERKNEKDW